MSAPGVTAGGRLAADGELALDDLRERVLEALGGSGPPTLDTVAAEAFVLLERVHNAADRLAEAGPVSEIVERAASEAATALSFDRVVLSRVDDGRLIAEAVHCGGQSGDGVELLDRLRAAPVQLGYPLVEAEILRRRRARLVSASEAAMPGMQAFSETMQWGEYVAAPVILEGRVIGFLHGDRKASGQPLRALDRDGLGRFADAFAGVFERAVLRRRLRIQRQELRQVASWADARTSELSDAAIDLAVERQAPEGEEALRAQGADSRLRDLLTRRELDVLEHMVKGKTNAEIAALLVVSAGTVKFHVKNILRKLNASNRAEAASRYLRLTMANQRPGAGTGAGARGAAADWAS